MIETEGMNIDPDDRRRDAIERLRILASAHAFEVLLETAGWKEIYALHTAWVEDARKILRAVDTSNTAAALDKLQRWQLAENLLELEVNYINDTLGRAAELKSTATLEDALMMEQYRHEQSESGDPGSGPDPTGH